jgi:hypothetical protein
MLATDSTGAPVVVSGSAVATGVAATLTTSVDCWFADDELADPDRFVGALPAAFGVVCESRCGAADVALCCATRDNTGFSSGDVAATAEGSAVRVGVASADAVVPLLVEVEPEWAPPELCTTPERGSAVELVSESTELCTASDVEPDEESSEETDGVVDDVASVDEAFAADPDDELDADDESDDESDDDPAELVSSGAANATAGVFATAAPRPSANARTPARMMCCASAGKAVRG